MNRFARLLAALAAVAFLMIATPASAQEDEYGCQTCENCHPGMACYTCASYVANAIGNCCGSGGGWSFCVNNEWGFFAQCSGGARCQCDDDGYGCRTLALDE
jgi:hypothetical protein